MIIPRMLVHCTGGEREFTVSAGSIADAIEAAKQTHPMLRARLEDESGAQRPHVSLFWNGSELKRGEPVPAGPVAEGDELLVIQAISGGWAPARQPRSRHAIPAATAP